MAAELSSDVLERQFGPTELEILQHDESGRIIATKTAKDGRILELSQVAFRAEGVAAFSDIHRKVTAGTSMGKAFREAGVAFRRQVRAAYRPEPLSVFSTRFKDTGRAAVIDVQILVGPDAIPYADILEVYTPKADWAATDTGMDKAAGRRLRAFGDILAAIGQA